MQALEGIRILDLSRLLPGPYCTMILADYGAEVIKIEEPGRGDYSRTFGPFVKDLGYWHLQVNRNKKSVVLNLKTQEDCAAFKELLKTADVVVESFRPGTLTKLGIDYEVAQAINPKIIYCSITGYGKKGPLAHDADHDVGYVSQAGIVSMSGNNDGSPALPPMQIADMGAAMLASTSILTALFAAAKTGKGQEIDISLYDTSLTMMPGAASLYFGSGFVAERGNNWLNGSYANYNIYQTKDGRYLSVGCLEQKFWQKLCVVLNRPDLIDKLEPESNHAYLKAELSKEFLKHTGAEWVELLAGKDTCTRLILNFDEAINSEQSRADEMLLTVDDPELGTIKQIGFPAKFSVTPGCLRCRAPRLGEHTKEVLAAIGINKE